MTPTLILAVCLGIIMGACATALWSQRRRTLSAFAASVHGHRFVPVVAVSLDNVTYLFSHGETEQVIAAMTKTMTQQRAFSALSERDWSKGE